MEGIWPSPALSTSFNVAVGISRVAAHEKLNTTPSRRREVTRAAPLDQDTRMGFRLPRTLRLAARVFWIAVFVVVFLLFSGALD
jgi:hypothetical protein